MNLRQLEIKCENCNTYNYIEVELGKIVFFEAHRQKLKCEKCGQMKYDAKSTRGIQSV